MVLPPVSAGQRIHAGVWACGRVQAHGWVCGSVQLRLGPALASVTRTGNTRYWCVGVWEIILYLMFDK